MIGRVAGSLAATLHGAGTHDATVIPPRGNAPSRPRRRSRLDVRVLPRSRGAGGRSRAAGRGVCWCWPARGVARGQKEHEKS